MSNTYFSSEKSMGRFFYVIGRTSDEFYTNGLVQLNIEQLVHMELKSAGYQRVIFLDKSNKLYTYDDESYSLNNAKGGSNQNNQDRPKNLLRENRGLKNGKINSSLSNTEQKSDDAQIEDNINADWYIGSESGFNIKNIKSSVLHMGSRDDFMISRKLEAYMDDRFIKTAIVINDPSSFLQDYGMSMHSFTTKYRRMLGTENENIIVFIFPNSLEKNIFDSKNFEIEDDQVANIIRIDKPDVNEIKNMLLFLKYKKNLHFKMSELNLLAVALNQAMGLSEIDITETYKLLESYAQKGNLLSEGLAYEVLGVSKPKSAEEQLQALIGMQAVKDELLEYKVGPEFKKENGYRVSRIKPDYISNNNDEMINFIITGSQGTGKSTVASLIGQLFYEMGYLKDGHVVKTNRSGLVAGYAGQTAIKTKNKVLEALGGVLFIDEAYALTRGSGNNSGDTFGQEAVDTLVDMMTDSEYKGKFILIAAGYDREMEEFLQSNSGLSGRFSKQLRIEDYTAEEMLDILVYQAKNRGYILSNDLLEEMPNFCENWVNQADNNWANAREAERLLNEIDKIWKRDSERAYVEDFGLIEKKHIPDSKMEYFKSVDELRTKMIENFNSMVGLNDVKDKINRMRRNIKWGKKTTPGHYVFVGNPGTGKTTIAKHMGEVMHNFKLLKKGKVIEYTAQDLISEYTNSNGNIRNVFDKAIENVLFIDESYQLLGNNIGEIILGALLPYAIDHEKDMCIILAGYEDDMDQLLSSNAGLKSRFNEVLHFDNYTGEELYHILLNTLDTNGIKYDSEYSENAKRILVRYIPEKSREKGFDNARYIIKKFIPLCEDKMHERLDNTYGDEFDESRIILTGNDFPEKLMKYASTKIRESSYENAIGKIKRLEGFDEIKKCLEDLMMTVEAAKREEMPHLLDDLSFHWVLKGNPGTGKTKIANLIGEAYKEIGLLKKGHVVIAKRQDLVAGYVGQTAIKTQAKINEAMGGILFIDEAYTLVEEHDGTNFGQEAIDTILEQMSACNGEFGVVAAGYPKQMEEFLNANPGFRSRFGQIFILEDYTDDELAKIFVSICEEKLFSVDDELSCCLPHLFAYMKKNTVDIWANAREAENLFRNMKGEWSRNIVTKINEDGHKIGVLTLQHLPKEYKGFVDDKERNTLDPDSILKNVNELIGFEQVKEKLTDFVNIVNAAKKENIPSLLKQLSYHWVLKGNPGTGKTTVAKLVGQVYKDLGLLAKGHVVVAKRQDLVAGYVGQTAIKTQKKIDEALGGILFIDEAYTLDGHSENDFGQEAIDTILEQMSARNGEFGVIVAGYPKEMDSFINTNPGLRSRFDQEFELSDYSSEELVGIFEGMVAKEGFEIDTNLKALLPNLFDVMKKIVKKGWANAREAEILFRKMKGEWSKNMIINVDDKGEKHLVINVNHLPKEYKSYIEQNENIEKAQQKQEKFRESMKSFSIDSSLLNSSKEDFDYNSSKEQGFLIQRKGTVFIRAITDDGEGQGSGSIITEDGYILTCEHVIHGCDNLVIMLKDFDGENLVTSWTDAEIVWFDEKIDLAIIKINSDKLCSLPLSRTSLDFKSGESIFMLGYPFGGMVNDSLSNMEASFFSGDIASKQVKNGEVRYLVGMEGKQGCSGAPVFSSIDGSIIGVFCGSQVKRSESLTEEVNYFRPISYIWDRIIKE